MESAWRELDLSYLGRQDGLGMTLTKETQNRVEICVMRPDGGRPYLIGNKASLHFVQGCQPSGRHKPLTMCPVCTPEKMARQEGLAPPDF